MRLEKRDIYDLDFFFSFSEKCPFFFFLPASAFYELNIASFNKISANHHISVMKAIIKCPLPIRSKCDADALVEISKAHCTFDVQLDKKSYFKIFFSSLFFSFLGTYLLCKNVTPFKDGVGAKRDSSV